MQNLDLKYKILKHPSDLKLKGFGKSKPELFGNLMEGMQIALRPKIKTKKAETKIRIESEDIIFLLFDFLNEVNYLNEVNHEIYQKIYFVEFSDTLIEAELFGKKVSRFGLQIKGVTLHDLDVHQRKDGTWEATVLFDL